MFSETTKELLEASKKIGDLRVELESKKKKKQPMGPLNYRFKKSTKSEIEELSCKLSDVHRNWNESEVARAAMYLGLKQLREVYDHDKKQASGLMHIIKMRIGFIK